MMSRSERSPRRRTYAITTVLLASAAMLSACDALGGNNAEPAEDETTPAPENTAETPAADEADTTEETDEASNTGDGEQPFAAAELADAVGNPIGTVSFTEAEDGVVVTAELETLSPGFRAVTVNENGLCEPQSANEAGQIGDFYSAGGVLPGHPSEEDEVIEGEDELETTPPPEAEGQEGTDQEGTGSEETTGQETIYHPDRAGDMPNVLIGEDGEGQMSFFSDRLTSELLLSEEGTAVIVHEDPAHYGNIPERYAPYGPDQESLATGDTGARSACGVVEEQ
ncbi:superoxide dismutase family protein [Nesterenkonia alba]|uniref:superoxide dismutase family protein n=1 Tax=Nesterenkonia alba TaxID=515814 RepID=UPI0003B50F88|nr:superoxide dismutase family protein [Nesterenkonia alba]